MEEDELISSETYEEVYEILSHMDKITVMKIPEDLLKLIIKNRNIDYKTRIDKNDLFNKQNISDEALDLLCYIDYHYWMDENKKKRINKILNDKNEAKKKKYNPNILFKKK